MDQGWLHLVICELIYSAELFFSVSSCHTAGAAVHCYGALGDNADLVRPKGPSRGLPFPPPSS
jgi:hypothetical protein